MNNNLLILGAGQYACVVEEIAIEMDCFGKIAFLDDNSKKAIGRLSEIERFKEDFSYGIVAIGNPNVRNELLKKLETFGFCIPTIVHPSAYVSKSATVGKGTVIEALSGVGANTVVGKGCIISMGAQINHNVEVGDCCHIDCGATVKSNSIIPEGTKICTGEIFK